MKTKLYIQYLKCGGCETSIITELNYINNITNVYVKQNKATVKFEYTTDKAIKKAKKALSKLGYPIMGKKNNFIKKTKSYLSCAAGKMNK